jgi:membrane associated rhomboid family serine protease
LDYLSKYNSRLYDLNLDFLNRFENHATDPNFIQASIEMVRGDFMREANIPMVGASGSVFGILMAFGLLFPNTELMLLFVPFPIKAKYFVTFYGLYELYSGIQNSPSDNVAHFAHIGGMLFAYILIRYWNNQRTNYY